MKSVLLFVLVLLVSSSAPLPTVAQAASRFQFNAIPLSAPTGRSSVPSTDEPSSSALDFAAAARADQPAATGPPRSGAGAEGAEPVLESGRPFHSLSVTAKVGAEGLGFDLATPISRRLKIRTGAQFFSVSGGFATDGLHTDGSIHLENVNVMLDFFPFHNGFHLSPGLAVDNNNRIAATVTVPGGDGFSLGGIGFTSSISDPVHGSGVIQFGNRVAPRFTLGWEDVLHHLFGRVTFPAEFGIQYSGAPKARLALAGTACADGGCLSVESNGIILATLLEIVRLQNNFSPLTVYPIASLGVRYTFGH